MSGKRIGYIRVSTTDQNPDRQLEGIELDRRFVEYASANNTERPQLKSLLDYVRDDDVVVVHSMDRLARRVGDLKRLVSLFVSKKVKIQFIKENLIFTDENCPISNLMLHMMAAFSEFEYSYIRERQMEGVEIAKRLGKYKGRKKISDEKIDKIKQLLPSPKKTKAQIAKELGVSRYTLWKYLKAQEKQQQEIA